MISPLQITTSPIDLISFLLFNPVLDIFYFGIIGGILLAKYPDLSPLYDRVWIGKLVNGKLEVTKTMHKRKGTKDASWNKGKYLLLRPLAQLRFRWQDVMIFDEDEFLPQQGFNTDKVTSEETQEEKAKREAAEKDKSKKDHRPLKFIQNPLYSISAKKVFDYFDEKVLMDSFVAIIRGKVVNARPLIILGLIVASALIGALLYGQFAPPHYVCPPDTICTTISHSTNSTSTTTLPSIITTSGSVPP